MNPRWSIFDCRQLLKIQLPLTVSCPTDSSWLHHRPRIRQRLALAGIDDAGRTVEVLVALTHATLPIAAILATNADGVRP